MNPRSSIRHRARAGAALAALLALVIAACQPSSTAPGGAPAPALATLTAAAGGSSAAATPAAPEGTAPADAGGPAGIATVAAQLGIENADVLPGDEAAGVSNAEGVPSDPQLADASFRATQEAIAAEANIADVDELVMSQPPLATFTPAPKAPAMKGELLYVRGGRFHTARADGSGQAELPVADRSMPSIWAPPEDPGRAWPSPNGREMVFFAGPDAGLWRMDVTGKSNRALLESTLPDESHEVAARGAAQRIKLRPGQDYTLIYMPGATPPFGVLVDNNEYHIRGEARLRVVHAARGKASTRLAVYVNGKSSGGPAAYGASNGEDRVSTGQVTIELRDDADKRVALLPSFEATDKDVRTVFVSGGDTLSAVGYSYPAGTKPASGGSRVRVFNASDAPLDVTIDGAVTAMRGISAGALSEYVALPGVMSRDDRRDAEISLYGLSPGEEPIAWSPDGERVAFLGAPDGRIDVYLADAKGAVRRLSDSPQREMTPRWSPDGKRLVWATIDEGYGENAIEVWDGQKVTSLDMAALRVRLGLDANANLVFPGAGEWVDDRRVFITPSAAGTSRGLWSFDVGTGALTPLVEGPIGDPSFSRAAGAWILNIGDSGELVRVEPDGGRTTLSRDAYGARWSPDGKQITYAEGEPASSEGWRLHVMDADGGNDRALTDRLPIMQESPPVPGPDAKRFWLGDGLLAFTKVGRDYGRRDREGVFGSAEAGRDIENLYAVGLDGKGGLIQATDMMKAFYINDVRPSPDGSSLAFIAFSYVNRAQQLYTVPQGGGKPIQIDGAVRWYTWLP